MAKAANLDFTNVKDGGNFSKRHQPAGDYPGTITKVQDAKAKSDGTGMWLFTIEVNGATYPLYCKFQENQLWKIRNLAVAAGMNVPKKRIKLDPNKLVGRSIGVTLEDEEYEGKMQSVVQATFPTSELGDSPIADDDDDDDEPPTSSKKKGKGKKAAAVEEVPDDEGSAKKSKKGKKKAASADELDELDVDSI
mgnify:CR=1 FL=1